MTVIRITVGVIHRCGRDGGRTVCTSAERVAAVGLKGRRSGGVWGPI